MAREYYHVEVKPTITASLQHGGGTGVFSTDDVLFDWTKIYMPRGNGRLIGTTVLVRGTDGVRQEHPFDLYFSKGRNQSDPVTLGTINLTVTQKPNNDLLAVVEASKKAYGNSLPNMSIMNIPTTARITMKAVKEPIGSGTAPTQNYCLWMGGIADPSTGASGFDWTTTCRINQAANFAAGASTTIITDGSNADISFAPGDVLHAHDDAIIGTVKSVSANLITLTDTNTAALLDDDYIYNINPMTFLLSFNMQN